MRLRPYIETLGGIKGGVSIPAAVIFGVVTGVSLDSSSMTQGSKICLFRIKFKFGRKVGQQATQKLALEYTSAGIEMRGILKVLERRQCMVLSMSEVKRAHMSVAKGVLDTTVKMLAIVSKNIHSDLTSCAENSKAYNTKRQAKKQDCFL